MSGAVDLPLAGVRVVDRAAGAMAGVARFLGELGAEVIRIEPAGGDLDRVAGATLGGVSLDYAAANLGKRVVADDRDAFAAIVATADILIETTAPASPEAAALNAVVLAARHPALVILSISDFGQLGPWRDWQATDAVLHALTGGLSRSGLPGRPPLLPPGALTLQTAIAQATFVALSAYIQRLRTGRGDRIDLSLLEAGMAALDPGFGVSGSAQSGVPVWKMSRGRTDERFRYPILPCADGFARLCVLAPRQWRGMFDWMGRPAEFAGPEWETLRKRFQSKELLPAITRFFADKTRHEIEVEGEARGIPTAGLLDIGEAVATPQMIARNAFVGVAVADGVTAPFPNGTIEIDGARAGVRGPVADVTQDAHFETARPAFAPPPAATRPLEGVKVLDLGVIVVGAETGRLLADQGAEVVKVENAAFPDGQRQSRDDSPITITFAAGHRNKRGLSIDLKSDAGKALFERLVREADVILSNFKPGTLAKLGFGQETLAALNPRIIAVDSAAFGPTGPWSGRLGYGPLVRASSGLAKQWTYPGEPESFSDAVTVYPDHVAARVGAIGALALLIRRMRTGTGGTASVSQAEVMLNHMGAQIAVLGAAAQGRPVTPAADPPVDWLVAAEGEDEWLVVSLRHAADRAALREVIGGEDRETLADWAATRSPNAAMEELQAAGVPAGTMLRVVELPQVAQYQALGTFRDSSHPYVADVSFAVEAAPARSALPVPDQRPAPLIGEHSDAVLRDWLALDDAAIARLVADKTIDLATPPRVAA